MRGRREGRLGGTRRRRRLEVGSELIVTSMVDMFSLLLTFLLNFVDPADPSALGVALPGSSSEEAVKQAIAVQISTTALRVDGREVTALVPGPGGPALPGPVGGGAAAEAVERALSDVLAARELSVAPTTGADESHTIVIECDRSVPFSLVGEVLDAARNAGVRRYRFAVVGSPRPPADPSAAPEVSTP